MRPRCNYGSIGWSKAEDLKTHPLSRTGPHLGHLLEEVNRSCQLATLELGTTVARYLMGAQ